MTKRDFLEKFADFGLEVSDAERAFTLMLWYGALGVVSKDGTDRFIYDYEYNMKRLNAEMRVLGEQAEFVTNPALHVALYG